MPNTSDLRVATLMSLALLQTTTRMMGEFFRECAALVIVFVPLEMWRDQALHTIDFYWHVGEVSAFSFVLGVLLEFGALAAGKAKGDLENGWRN